MGKTEEWKDVKGYEGFYQVSNKGNVRNIGYMHGGFGGTIKIECNRLLTPTDNGNGYLIVGLQVNHKRKNHYVHRLVADAFLAKPVGKSYVNHIDYNKKNNDVSNLEWCTQVENIDHSKPNRKPQRVYKTNSGHRYITVRKNTGLYRVCIKRANVDKSFSNLEEAIKYRNEVCNEIGYTF